MSDQQNDVRGFLRIGPLMQAVLIGLALIIASLVYYNYARDRSITVAVLSEFMRLEATQKAVWRFEEGLVCVRNSVVRSRTPPRLSKLERKAIKSGENCGEREDERRGHFVVALQPKTVVSLRQFGSGTVQITILNEKGIAEMDAALSGVDLPLPKLSRILVAKEEMTAVGVLHFDGRVQFGQEVKNGVQAILRSGSYEMREELPFRSGPIVVNKGALFRGDTVRLVGKGGKEQASSGFISMPQSDKRGFQVVATFMAESAALKLQRADFKSTMLTPKWTDRALADPFTIAMAALLGVLAALVTLISELVSLLAAGSDPHELAIDKNLEQDQENDEVEVTKPPVDKAAQSGAGSTNQTDNTAKS